ncbi:MAG: phosphatidylserine decarboxylase [Ignavibacteriales bacterium]|nr:MAG: phosphatidylserine decarboxylase [Ignavibacteriales bacterium]
MILSTRNSILGKIADNLGLNKNFNKYTKVEFDPDDSAVISPVEAKVIKIGDINSDGILLSKKDKEVKLDEITGNFTNHLKGYKYINFYLNPSNKHFWVTPFNGMFIYTHKNEGKAWLPVYIGLENIFGIEMFSKAVKKNASICSVFKTRDYLLALIAVGSLNVNRIHIDYDEMYNYKKGTPCGYFSIGSTMLLCFPKHLEILIEENSDVKIGQRILI